jgi:hypothetical protein
VAAVQVKLFKGKGARAVSLDEIIEDRVKAGDARDGGAARAALVTLDNRCKHRSWLSGVVRACNHPDGVACWVVDCLQKDGRPLMRSSDALIWPSQARS